MSWKSFIKQEWRKTVLLALLLLIASTFFGLLIFKTKIQTYLGFPWRFYGEGIFPWLGDLEDKVIFSLPKLLGNIVFWFIIALLYLRNRIWKIVIISLSLLLIGAIFFQKRPLLFEPSKPQTGIETPEKMSIINDGVKKSYFIDIHERSNQLGGNTKLILQLDNVSGWLKFSPNGGYLAASINKKAKIYDLSSVTPKPLEDLPYDHISITFGVDDKEILIGGQAGGLFRYDLSSQRQLGERIQVTHNSLDEIILSPDGQMLGWYDAEINVTGLFDLRNQKELSQWRNIQPRHFLSEPSKHIEFTPDGKRILFYIEDGLCDFGCLAVWNISEGRIEAMFDVYVLDSSIGYAFVNNAIYYGTRSSGPYQIRRYDLIARTDTIIDSNARNIHFIDLFPSRGGNFVAEWDFEERGVRIYNIQKNHSFLTLPDNEMFIGWDSVSDILFTANMTEKKVSMWNPEKGERLGTIDALSGRQGGRIEAAPDGRFLTVIGDGLTLFRISDRN